MVEWLKSLPKTAFVTLVLSAGVLFIVFSDPPRSVCDTQISKLDEAIKDFLSLDQIKKPNRKQTRFTKLVETCKVTNSAGGCYELFLSLKEMLKDVGAVSPECIAKLTSHTAITETVWTSLDLMTRLAWGEKPPEMATLRTGWFDPADLNLFCELKRTITNIYSDTKWNSFVEAYFTQLPGAKSLDRTEAWQRMLFSVNCSLYL